jgi:hypothetical protein
MTAFHAPREAAPEADYAAMWHWIQRLVEHNGHDLATIRSVTGQPGRQKGSRELEKLRLQVTFMLSEAGYRRADIADFLFVSENCICQRLRRYKQLQDAGVV